jgi:hypothetical protein
MTQASTMHAQACDHMTFGLSAEHALANEPVRVQLPVTLTRSSTAHTESNHEAVLQEPLQSLLPVEWVLTNLLPEQGTRGPKRWRCTASAMVERQHLHQLQSRIKQGSKNTGIEMGEPELNFAITQDRLNAILRRLRAEIIQNLSAEMEELKRLTNRDWRIGNVTFKSNSSEVPSDYIDTMKNKSHANKVSMAAEIILKASDR